MNFFRRIIGKLFKRNYGPVTFTLPERKKQLKKLTKNRLVRMILLNETILAMIVEENEKIDLNAYKNRVRFHHEINL